MLMIMRKTRDTSEYAPAVAGVSNIPALDLFGQRLHEIRNLLQIGIDGERAAKCLQRELVFAKLLHDDPEAGERAEMTRLAPEHLLDVGECATVVPRGESQGRAPIPA